jgi:hypothetical protein
VLISLWRRIGGSRFQSWTRLGYFDPQSLGGWGIHIYVGGSSPDFDMIGSGIALLRLPKRGPARAGPPVGLPWPPPGVNTARLTGVSAGTDGNFIAVGQGVGPRMSAIICRGQHCSTLAALVGPAFGALDRR